MASAIVLNRQVCIAVIQGTLDEDLPKISAQDPELSRFVDVFRTVIMQAITIARTAQSDIQALPYIHKVVKLGRDLLMFEFRHYEERKGASMHDKSFKDVVFSYASLEIELEKAVKDQAQLVEVTVP